MLVQTSVTHTQLASHVPACYQQLPNRTYVEFTFENGHYPVAEIQKVTRCTTASSVTLNWYIEKTIVELLLTDSFGW